MVTDLACLFGINDTFIHLLSGLFVLSGGALSHICSLAYSGYHFRNIWFNCSLQVRFFSLFSEYFAKFPWSWPSDVLTSLFCSGFWPSVKVFLYQIPVVGWILQYFWWLVIPLLWCFIFMAGTQFYVSKCSIFLFLSILGLCFMFCKPFLLQIIDCFWGSFV